MIEDIVEMNERDREERGTGMKGKKKKKSKHSPLPLPATRIEALPNCKPISVACPGDDTFASHDHP